MNHYADFDPCLHRQRRESLRQEVQTLRLEKRLRESGETRSGARLADLVSRGTLPLLRRVGVAVCVVKQLTGMLARVR